MGKRVDIAKRLEELGVDPLLGMLRIGEKAERAGNLALALKVNIDLLEYIAPKLKSMEFSIEPETREFLDRHERLARIKALAQQVQLRLGDDNVIDAEPPLLHIPDTP